MVRAQLILRSYERLLVPLCKQTVRLAFLCLPFSLVPLGSGLAQSSAAAEARRAADRSEAGAATQLPVTRVSLYKNGVGFFEHAGRVTGDGRVTIDFTTAQLNDVLQSLTAIDLNGGRIAGAGYNSTTPVEQQLKALPLGLGQQPTELEFYSAIRGARVEVRGAGAVIVGRLLNMEIVNGVAKDGQQAVERRLLTLVGDGGEVRTIELTNATSVRLLDQDLHVDVTRYLQLLASTRNEGLRHLTIEDHGTGTRELRVSYLSEVPIWKSTYRILFTEPVNGTAGARQTATLQGWSVVDNTTGADWNRVQLSLIAGAPQSFIQPLSVPYYSRRPEIPLPQEAQLTPQTHESGEMLKEEAPPPPSPPVPMAARAAPQRGLMGGAGAGSGIGAGGPSATVAIQNQSFAEMAVNSFRVNATASAFDDYFEYRIGEPVTIRKNESAMVPILQTKVDAERVTLWSTKQPTPLRALWITNTSKLTLDRGSFSIVEDDNFGGEGLLDPIHPAERRLLSYAVDQAVRVTSESSNNSSRVVGITASKGVLQVRESQVSELEYLVRNAAAESRTVVVEHPVLAGYTLDSEVKPEETTPAVYRFRVVTKPGETVRLHVGQRRANTVRYQLTNSNDAQLAFFLNQTNGNPAVKQALEPILEARRRVAGAQSAVDSANTKLTGLRADEERERANVTALANTDKGSRERFVRELNATEDAIAAAQKDLAAAESNLKIARDDLSNRIETLQINETL